MRRMTSWFTAALLSSSALLLPTTASAISAGHTLGSCVSGCSCTYNENGCLITRSCRLADGFYSSYTWSPPLCAHAVDLPVDAAVNTQAVLFTASEDWSGGVTVTDVLENSVVFEQAAVVAGQAVSIPLSALSPRLHMVSFRSADGQIGQTLYFTPAAACGGTFSFTM